VLDDPMAEGEVAGHLRPAQVQIPIVEPHGFVDVGLIGHAEGRSEGGVEHADRLRQHLDLARGEILVLCAGRPGIDHTGYLDDILRSALCRDVVGRLRDLGIDDNLRQAVAVA